ncbi:MAG: hypothetical protein WBO77_00955 [Microgenomates group bacterium]
MCTVQANIANNSIISGFSRVVRNVATIFDTGANTLINASAN